MMPDPEVGLRRITKRGAAYLVEGWVNRRPTSFWLTAQDVETMPEAEFLAFCTRGLRNCALASVEL